MPNKIRILFIIDGLEYGGTQRQLEYLFAGLNKNYFEIYLCYFTDEEDMLSALSHHCIEVCKIAKRKKIDFSLINKIHKLIRDKKISIVQTFLITADIWGRLGAFLNSDVKVISSKRNQNNLGVVRTFLMKLFDKRSDAIVSNCEEVEQFILKTEQLPVRKMEIIHNGIDIEQLENMESVNIKQEYNLDDDAIVVGTVGRLVEVKNHLRFISIAECLSKRINNIYFLIIGSGPEEQKLKATIATKGLKDRVIMAGAKENAQGYIKSFDIYVSTSVKEGFSNTIMEAMALHKVIWATPVGAAQEIISNGLNGYLLEEEQDNYLELYENSNNKKEEIGKLAYETAKKYEKNIMVEKYQDLYKRLINRPD